MPDSQRYPWNLNRINIVEDTDGFLFMISLFIYLFIYDNSHMFYYSNNHAPARLKMISFQNYKHWYIIHTSPDKTFKGTVVNQALLSLHGGSLKITLTVLLIIHHKLGKLTQELIINIFLLKEKIVLFVQLCIFSLI